MFPDDINDLPPECDVKFTVKLITGTSLESMDPYMMSSLELSELKKHLKEFLVKNFI